MTLRLAPVMLCALCALTLSACEMYGGEGMGETAALNIPDVADGDIDQSTMVDVTRTLSSDAFEGRVQDSVGRVAPKGIAVQFTSDSTLPS